MVHRRPIHLTDVHGVDIADWHGWVQVLHLTLRDVSLILAFAIFPARPFKEQAVDVDALGGHPGDFRKVTDVVETAPVGHVVQRQVVASSRNLHVRGQERHRIEQTADPNGLQQLQLGSPVDHLFVPLDEISKPGAQGFQRGVRLLGPNGIDFVGLQVSAQVLHLLRDVQCTTDAKLKLQERRSDCVQQGVDSISLLQGHHHERSVVLFLEPSSDVDHIQIGWQRLEVAGDDRLGQGNVSGTAAATTASDFGDGLEDADALVRQEADLRVRMQSKHLGHLHWEALLNVLHVV
mmetsp:Transcript_31542/g.72894  ORF Transcript_31542/g.72894 Transcript_31542/m.72894 type:complete len:292 (+) Transcript_31542:290-1165(+)